MSDRQIAEARVLGAGLGATSPVDLNHRTTESLSVSDVSLTANRVPSGLSDYLGWMLIDPYKTKAELRRAESFSGNTITWTDGLSYSHSANAPIFFLPRPFLYVTWFGAVGNYPVDDATPIQRAIDQAASYGAYVFFPRAMYGIGSQISQKGRVNLVGDGRDSVIAAITGTFPTSTAAIRMGTGADRIFNTRIENMRILLNSISGSIGVYSTDLNEQCGLRHVLIDHYDTAAISLDGTSGQMENFEISDVECNSGSSSSDGILIDDTEPHIFTGISIVPDGSTTSTGAGIHATGSTQLHASNVHVERHADGILFASGTSGSAINIDGFTVTDTVHIATTGKVTVMQIQKTGTTTNAVNDAQNGVTFTDTYVPFYSTDEAPIDYSGTSTFTGWSSFSVKKLDYWVSGKKVTVQFLIVGTSDNATTRFTLPYAMKSGLADLYVPVAGRDNGSDLSTPALMILTAGSNNANFYKDMASAAFTASNGKYVAGQFTYERS